MKINIIIIVNIVWHVFHMEDDIIKLLYSQKNTENIDKNLK